MHNNSKNGAISNYTVTVLQYVDGNLPNRWIARADPITCPRRLPDLAPRHYFSWKYLRRFVFGELPTTIEN